MDHFDIIVIGGGAAGLTAAAGAASFGVHTALIDSGPLGGDCLWTGCVPSKSLLNISQVIYTAKQASQYGFDQVSALSFKKVQQQIASSIEIIQEHDDPERFRSMGVKLFRGTARFQDAHSISIDGKETLRGKRIIVATGSKPIIPSIPGLRETGFITNESFFKQPELPSSWLVIGSGPVGLEFSQALLRLGCKVTLVEQAAGILPRADREIAKVLEDSLRKEGLSLFTGTKVQKVSKSGPSIQVVLEKGGDRTFLEVDQIMVAAGRMPNVEKLSLHAAGVEVEDGCIKVTDWMQTNRPHIYAVGDVNGRAPYTHVAGWEAKTALSHALFGVRRKMDYTSVPSVIYTDPEIFQLGLTEWEARQVFSKIRTYKTNLAGVDRFITDGQKTGLMKIVTDYKGNIIGAHAVGRGAGDYMQEVVFAKQHRHKIGSLSQVIHPYPSHVEAVQKTADLYWREKLFTGFLGKWLKFYVRWLRL